MLDYWKIPKHVVYEGVLHEISGGEVIQGTGGGWTRTGRYREPRDYLGQRGWTRREFVDVGDTRIRSLTLTPYEDALLQEAVGEEVALSVAGGDPGKPNRHTVLAMRTPRGGVIRPGRIHLLVSSIYLVVRFWFGGVIFAVLTLVAGAIAGKIFDPLFYVGAALAVALLLWFLVIPFVASRRAFAAAAALGPAGHGGGMPARVG